MYPDCGAKPGECGAGFSTIVASQKARCRTVMRCTLNHLPPLSISHEFRETMQVDINNAAHPNLWRRLAAIFYDSWLVAGIWLVGTTADTLARAQLGLGTSGSHLALQIFWLAAPALFFGWFWTHGGQTLGMRAWRLKLLDRDGAPVTWWQSLRRYLGAWLSLLVLGLGYLWIWVDRDQLAWHDRLSGTRLVILARK